MIAQTPMEGPLPVEAGQVCGITQDGVGYREGRAAVVAVGIDELELFPAAEMGPETDGGGGDGDIGVMLPEALHAFGAGHEADEVEMGGPAFFEPIEGGDGDTYGNGIGLFGSASVDSLGFNVLPRPEGG